MFDGLKNATKEFADLLKENAGLSEAIAGSFQNLISAGLETSTELALDLFNYLAQNPDALSEMVEVLDTFVRLLADATRLAVELGRILGPVLEGAGVVLEKTAQGYQNIRDRIGVGGKQGTAGRQVARELGFSQQDFDEKLSEKAKSTDGFNSRIAVVSDKAREQAVGEMEENITTSLDTIALAELERAIDIEKMVLAGALSHEQAEIRKLESTKQRIQEELFAEQEKLNSAESEEERFHARQAIADKTIDLLKVQQEIEAKIRDLALAKLREQVQLQQQQLGLQQQALSIQQQELKDYDSFLNQLSLVEASLERQQRLQNAQNDLEGTIINAQIERSNLRLQQLEKANSLYQQLQGDISEEQRRVLTQELGTLGLAGRVTEREILQAIFQEERRQFQLKREALEQQQEIERKSLQFEKEKTQLQIQQNNLAADRAVKEAQVNLEQSRLQNQQRQLETQTKLKEAQIQASSAKTEEEKAQAQALVNLYSQQLGLIQKQGQLLIAQGQSAINIAQQNRQSIAQEGATSLQELGLKEEALDITQYLDRDRLNNEFQNDISNQRIAESQLSNLSSQALPTGNVIPVREITNTRIGGDREPLSGNRNRPVLVTPQPRDNLFNALRNPDISELASAINLTDSVDLAGGLSLGLADTLNSPILSTPDLGNSVPESSVDSNVFQDKVLLNMQEIISILSDTQPITQNNDYSLYANNDTEILQQAKSQSLDDLVVIINSVTGKFAGS
ncbi:hypothetical protein CWATWH0401_3264 [Crocosphaera watsonii WH 0401]|uniref:Uncharacterized protein n=1 Tax=Crocosphaera watsonii WH 0401 TaxID=555881 RepID=T2J9I3_CROWT|nr:hypothetical protein CWATWH0401_3264 [Crocosphaera watsonii WH 0401]